MSEALALRLALGLNLVLAAVEIVAGLWSRSVALLVDAADFVEDSVIYGLALRLGGRAGVDEARHGLLIAGLMAVPGAVALWQLLQRFLSGGVPHGQTIWAVSGLALVANLAMIGAGVAVVALQSAWPDTVVGLGVAALHFSGAVAVARLALSRKDLG